MLWAEKTLHHFHGECVQIELSRDCIGYAKDIGISVVDGEKKLWEIITYYFLV